MGPNICINIPYQVAKRAENFQANLERMTQNMKEENTRKLDTFFEAEEIEEVTAPKKK